MNSQEATDSLESLVGPGESKQLTILFYDLVDSTELSRRICDPESWLEIQNSIHTKFGVILTDHGGYQYDVQGDGAFYLFGLRSMGDPVAGAANAALALMLETEELNGTLPLPDLPDKSGKWKLQFRVIITSGLIAAMPHRRPGAAGDALNLPSRLKDVCDPCQIVIDKATSDRLGRSFHLTALEPKLFKGIDSKVEAFGLVARQSGQTKFDARIAPGLGPLVGRQPELTKLSKQWELAREGQGQAGFIVGNAGIGKSRLALAVSRLAAKGGISRKYQCSELYRSKALYPFLDGLRRDARIQYDDKREDQIAKLRTFLGNSAAASDELCEYMLEIRSIRDAEGDRKQHDLRERTLQLMCEQLTHVADSRPCLLMIEDLQWIDPTSLELLTTIIQLTSGLRLFVLATSREESMIPPLGDNANVYRIGPLSEGESLEVIINAFQDIHCPPSVAAAIIKRTEPERLPLYLEELAYSIREKLAAPAEPHSVTIPVSVEMCLREMLDQLSREGKFLAQIASVIGPRFSRALLASICWGSMDFEQAFRALEESRFISSSKDPQFEYRFRHELLRDAVYQSMLRSQRRQIHQDIAVAVSTSHHHIEDQVPEFVAHHWSEAGNAVRAVEYLSKACERAIMRSAVREAFGHFHHALDLIDKDRDGKIKQFKDPDETELMLRVRACGVEAAIKGYSAQESQGNWRRILKLSKDLSHERFNAHLGLAASIYVHGELDEALEHGRKCLDMAARMGSTDQALHAHRILCEISFYMGEFAKCCDCANESIVLYTQEDHQRLIGALGDDPKVLCLMYRALSHWILGRADLSIADCKQALALSAELGHPYSSAQAKFYASWLYALMRDRDSAELFASTAIKTCEEGGFDLYGGLAHVIHGWAISVGSDATSAIVEMSEGIKMVRGPEADICLSCFLPWLAEAYLLAGKLDEGITIMREADEFAQEKFYEGERWRVKGDLYSASARSKAERGVEEATKEWDIAKECYAQALKVAHKGKNEAKAFQLRTMISMCKNGFCGVEGLQPLLERMGGEDHDFEDHDLNEARRMLGLST
jgi:class 3 adenylate cyclase/tetratricopeptide (TPR) repeat protein